MRTDVLKDVDWRGVETEQGNTIYGWHLGTVCLYEHDLEDGKRFEVYVSHPQPDGTAVVLHWCVFGTREPAVARHNALIRQLKEVGEHGLFARQFESCADELAMDDGRTWGEFRAEQQSAPSPRCNKCWKASPRCQCSEPELVRDVLAQVREHA